MGGKWLVYGWYMDVFWTKNMGIWMVDGFWDFFDWSGFLGFLSVMVRTNLVFLGFIGKIVWITNFEDFHHNLNQNMVL